MNEIKPLKPFRFWAQKVIPLVYEESLSYYELLCKVIEYLNTMGVDFNELLENFIEFDEDMTNKFNDLSGEFDDLSGEFGDLKDWAEQEFPEFVSDKLDEMAEDGTLTNLIAPYLPFVTPEMFGAVGDGVTDDTNAVQSAINGNKCVILSKKYFITQPLKINSTISFYGNCAKDYTEFNLKFDTTVKACIVINANYFVSCNSVGFIGTNDNYQALFVSEGTTKAYVNLINCLISSFDCAFAGVFSLTKSINCTFYRIASALILGNPLSNAFSYDRHTELLTAINSQLTNAINTTSAGFGESVFDSCYISGQGASHNHTGLFVGGNPFDVKFIGCYIDYWSAILIDAYTATMVSEPITFIDCSLDSIITLNETAQNTAFYITRGISIIGGIFCRFNRTFNSNVIVDIYDFIRKIPGGYPSVTDVVIKDVLYLSTSTNATLNSYKFINLDTAVTLANCEFDFRTKSNVNMSDLVTLAFYSTGDRNKLPILNYKNYDSMPRTNLTGAACDSFNGHIFTYNNDLYMNVNGTAYKLNNA